MMLFCVLRRRSTAADSPLQRPPVAEPRLHPAVSFQRFLDVKRPRWFVAIRSRVTVLTDCSGLSEGGGSSLWRSGSLIRPW